MKDLFPVCLVSQIKLTFVCWLVCRTLLLNATVLTKIHIKKQRTGYYRVLGSSTSLRTLYKLICVLHIALLSLMRKITQLHTVAIAIIYLGYVRVLKDNIHQQFYKPTKVFIYIFLLPLFQGKVWRSGRVLDLKARDRWIEPTLCCLVFFHRKFRKKTNVYIANVGEFHPLKRKHNRKITKNRKFPSFKRECNWKISKSRKFPSFEKGI